MCKEEEDFSCFDSLASNSKESSSHRRRSATNIRRRRPVSQRWKIVMFVFVVAPSGRLPTALAFLRASRSSSSSSSSYWSTSQRLSFATSTNVASTPQDNGVSFEEQTSGLILPSHPDKIIRSVMAPMVAASDYPFRCFLRKHCGVDLTYTQMLHSKNFCKDPKFRRSHLDLYEAGARYAELVPSQLECLGEGNAIPEVEHERAPLMVQLAGHEPDMVVQSALMIMEHTDGQVTGFDLNCGCPQAIARKGRYGAFLMEEDDRLVCSILAALRKALPESVAVSVKIRLPLDDNTLQDRIPRIVDTGINFMTVHGRTLVENKTKVGAVHRDRIRFAIEAAHRVNKDFPVVANGGMETYHDVQEILKATGAVAAMSSEALLETPNIFMPNSLDLTSSARSRLEQQFSFARDYLDICATTAPPMPGVLGMSRYKGGSFSVVRGHLLKFLHRYVQEHPDLRDRLATDPRLRNIPQAQSLVEDLYERYATLSEEELSSLKSGSNYSSWYRRHRQPGRFVHQKEVRIDSSSMNAMRKEESAEERKRRTKERIETLRIRNQERAASTTKRFI